MSVSLCFCTAEKQFKKAKKRMKYTTVPSEIQWTSFFLFLNVFNDIISDRNFAHAYSISPPSIHCMLEHLRLENEPGISCKIKEVSRSI